MEYLGPRSLNINKAKLEAKEEATLLPSRLARYLPLITCLLYGPCYFIGPDLSSAGVTNSSACHFHTGLRITARNNTEH